MLHLADLFSHVRLFSKATTQKLYAFEERAVLTRKGTVWRWFSDPEVKNYPVQGTAADIVSLQVGKVFKYMMQHRDKGLMVNEIHDSVILDVKKKHAKEITLKVKAILEDVSGSFKEKFNLKFDAPIRVDYNYGKNWKECK